MGWTIQQQNVKLASKYILVADSQFISNTHPLLSATALWTPHRDVPISSSKLGRRARLSSWYLTGQLWVSAPQQKWKVGWTLLQQGIRCHRRVCRLNTHIGQCWGENSMPVSPHSPVNVQRLLKMNQQQKLIGSVTSPFYASHWFTEEQDLDGKWIIKMGKYSTIPKRKIQTGTQDSLLLWFVPWSS